MQNKIEGGPAFYSSWGRFNWEYGVPHFGLWWGNFFSLGNTVDETVYGVFTTLHFHLGRVYLRARIHVPYWFCSKLFRFRTNRVYWKGSDFFQV